MPANGPKIVERYNRMLNDATPHFTRCEEIARFVAPSRLGILTDRIPGQSQTEEVYDGTSQYAAGILAKFIVGQATNQSTRWSRFKHADPEANKLDSIKEWFEECTDRWHAELNKSNFYQEHYQKIVDWCGFGTGSNLLLELPVKEQVRYNKRGFYFSSDKIGRFLIAEDATGRVDTHYAEFSYTAGQAVARWGLDKCPDGVKKAYESNKPDERFKFIRAIQPREPGAKREYSGSKGMPWALCYVEKESKQIVEESGFEEFPAQVPRWEKTSSEPLGRASPGELSLPDVKTLNRTKQMSLEDFAFKIRPPVLQAHDSVIGKIRLVPAGLTTLRVGGRAVGDLLAPFETGSHPEISQLVVEDLRKSISRSFFIDQIMALMEQDLKDVNNFTYAKRLELMQQIVGPVYNQLVYDDFHPLHDRGFALMFRMGKFSPPPDEIFEFGGDVDVEYESPLARAQKAGEVDAMNHALADIAPLGELEMKYRGATEILDGIDADKWREHVFDIRGVPASVRYSTDEIEAIRNARSEQNQKEQMNQELMATAEGMGKMAPALKVLQGGQAA